MHDLKGEMRRQDRSSWRAAQGPGIPIIYPLPALPPLYQVFNIFTLAVKFLSCALSVASGLPVGPEGPLIHIGASLGSAISQGHSTTMKVGGVWG